MVEQIPKQYVEHDRERPYVTAEVVTEHFGPELATWVKTHCDYSVNSDVYYLPVGNA